MLKKDKKTKNILKKDKRTKQILLGALVLLLILDILSFWLSYYYIEFSALIGGDVVFVSSLLDRLYVPAALLTLFIGWAIFKTFQLGRIGVITMILFGVHFLTPIVYSFEAVDISDMGPGMNIIFLILNMSILLAPVAGFVSSILFLWRGKERALGIILLAFFGLSSISPLVNLFNFLWFIFYLIY